MDVNEAAKLVNTAGLIYDILGAIRLWRYAFQRPMQLIEQVSASSGMIEKIVDGRSHRTYSGGVEVNPFYKMMNDFYEYKDILCSRRIRLGLCFLIFGFLLQVLSNFMGPYLCTGLSFLLILIMTFFLINWFTYQSLNFKDIPEPRIVHSSQIFQDKQFIYWWNELRSERKKIGLSD